MKRFAILTSTVLMVATAAIAKEYRSSFGFTFTAPDAWLVMTKPELAANPVFASADPGIKAKVNDGAVEILYDKTTSDATFTDYVDVKAGLKGVVPNTPEAVKAECARYGEKLAKVAGRTLAMAACEARSVGAARTFYVEHEGRVSGTVTLQYQLVRPDGRLLYVTATCKQSSLDRFRPDFEAVVRSIRMN